MIIGIMGYKGSGKDTVADFLVSNHGYRKLSFSDPLKEMALVFDPLIYFNSDTGEPVRLSAAVKREGWDVVKRKYPEARRTLQRLATEVIRDNVSEDFWVDKHTNSLTDLLMSGQPNIVVPDVRFSNELSSLIAFKAEFIVVQRDGVDSDGHSSEKIPPYPGAMELHNNGTKADLHKQIDQLILA